MALIGESIREFAYAHPHKEAIVCGDNPLSYLELQNQIDEVKSRLRYILGSTRGKKIGFLLKNGPEWLVTFLAISASGGVAIPFDSKWPESQRKDVREDASLDLFIYEKRLVKEPFPKSISMDDLHQLPVTNESNEPISGEDLFYIGYTSGTTGRPKGFMRTHQSWADCFTKGADVFSLKAENQILSPGPLVHSHFLYAAVQTLHIGATLYLLPSFQAEEVWDLLEQKEFSALYIVPTMFEALKRTCEGRSDKLLHTILSSGAKWEKPSKQQAAVVFPKTKIYEYYGASELSFVSVQKVFDKNLPDGAIGKPFPDVELKILNDQGQEVRQDEVGTLYVRSPWIFKGYVNLPEKTREMFQGEWATVGDLAYIDKNKNLILIGRKQNMIISGGLNVYPEEVEKVIHDHSRISEAIVLGVPDDYWGEKVIALVQKLDKVTNLELKDYCRAYLPNYKCPKEWIEVDEFFYTISGKVARKRMKEWLESKEEGKYA